MRTVQISQLAVGRVGRRQKEVKTKVGLMEETDHSIVTSVSNLFTNSGNFVSVHFWSVLGFWLRHWAHCRFRTQEEASLMATKFK